MRPTKDAKRMKWALLAKSRRRRRRRRRCHKWNLRHSSYVLMWAYWLIQAVMSSRDAWCMHSVNCIHSDIRQIRSKRIERRARRARKKKSIIKRRRVSQRTEECSSSRFFSLVFCLKQKRVLEWWCGIPLSGCFLRCNSLALKSSISFIKFFPLSSFRSSVDIEQWKRKHRGVSTFDVS